jgi:hypothetical protein
LRKPTKFLLLAVALSPALFAFVSGNIWEDFFITYRCSLNLVHGNGLVYEAGRRVHVFTSPLGVLVPAGISWLLRTDDPLAVLAVFRAMACAALAAAWGLTASRLLGAVAAAIAGALWVLDVKLAAYSTNGMETAFLVLFVLLAWKALFDGRLDWAGVALGGAMWTRPDGFVFVGAAVVGCWIFPGATRPPLRSWLRMGVIAGLIYVPWFVWAWMYYGSPVPNTILAKGSFLNAAGSLKLLATYPVRYVFGHCAAHDAFLPPYFFFGGWPDQLWWFGKAMSLATAGVVFWPGAPRAARTASAAFVVGGLYLTLTTRAPWYFPMWQIFAYLAVGGGTAALLERLAHRPLWRVASGAAVVAMIGVQAWLFAAVTAELRAQQELIEWGVRAPIGRAIAKAAHSPKETVFLEPLGYIGFYSGLAMRDTPGLCAPEVTALRKTGVVSMSGIIAALRPDWTVLRTREYAEMSSADRQNLASAYELFASYNARPQIDQVTWLPGRNFLYYDAQFLVLRKKEISPPGP